MLNCAYKGFIYKCNHSLQMIYSSEINYLKSRVYSHYIYTISRVSYTPQN